jgi:2-haloacid dehalogenase
MPAPARPEAVVFDLGNVLISWDRRFLYRSLFPDEEQLQRFLDDVYTLEVNERLDLGQPLAEFCRQLAAQHPHYETEILALETRWPETIGGTLDDTVAVLRELVDRGIPCYALSNWNGDTYALIEGDHEFLGWFDGVVLSGHEGVTKPDPQIFRLLCSRYGLEPGGAFFVDDSKVNVDAARAVGMDAELFVDADGLRRALQARGLLA